MKSLQPMLLPNIQTLRWGTPRLRLSCARRRCRPSGTDVGNISIIGSGKSSGINGSGQILAVFGHMLPACGQSWGECSADRTKVAPSHDACTPAARASVARKARRIADAGRRVRGGLGDAMPHTPEHAARCMPQRNHGNNAKSPRGHKGSNAAGATTSGSETPMHPGDQRCFCPARNSRMAGIKMCG